MHAAGGDDVFVTGVTVVNSREGGRTIATLNLSLMLSVVANLAVIAFAFRSIPIGILSFLPNILPLLATGSYLFLSGRGMQFTSVVALTVAFGIAVDGSVHFLNRFKLPQNASLPLDQRLIATCSQVGPVLFGTTLIIIAGLSTTLTSGMPSVSLFGWIAALTLAVALIGDLVILPGLMAGIARRWFDAGAGDGQNGRNTRMRKHLVGLVVLAALAGSGPIAGAAADDAFLSHFAGTWIGRGTMQTSPTAEPERVYCKITNTLSADGNTLTQDGRCAIASNSGGLSGAITSLGKGAYSGTLDSFASREPATLSGTLRGSQLVMHSKYTDKLSGEEVEATNTLALVANGYTLTATRTDPASGSAFTSSKIAFTPK